jgi:hypothetical protein
VAKVELHLGERFPRMGHVGTNLETESRAVVPFHNKRGTAKHGIKVGWQMVKMTRLSCHRYRSNRVRLWLSVRAYNLGTPWRCWLPLGEIYLTGWPAGGVRGGFV